jgi:hypothetical protein
MSAQPWELKPSLSEDRLNFLAQQFREIYHGVETTLHTDDDCNFCRGTLFFGRARQRLIRIATSGRHPWLELTNSAMDVTLTIDGMPFRFFRDDVENPSKRGFWRRNMSDRLFSPSEQEPVIFRFIVQRPISDQEELDVFFIGYNEMQEAVCEWKYGGVTVLTSVVARELPIAVELPPASVEVPADDRLTGSGLE